ncbi:MAG TPA: dihydropteroate synthase [Nannocystaceae bacterium]|nr:dihydropteroate synthase [Nannocystaceae bacterium]
MPPRTAPALATGWVHACGVLPLDRPRVMGVVNLTPDSFHDGGRLMVDDLDEANVSVALRRCEQLVAHGADLLDLGGESTRPGSIEVPIERERTRVLPLLAELRRRAPEVPISVDTRHAAVARAAIEAGAAIVNDVSGLADPAMVDVVAASSAGLVIGHLRGEPRTMQDRIAFGDLLGDVAQELARAVDSAVAAGIPRERILVDPGIGFGKTAEQSAALVAASSWLRAATGCHVLVGASRKSFLGVLAGAKGADRLIPSLSAALVAVERGASVLRVHDVQQTVVALAVARAIRIAFDREAAGREPPSAEGEP